MLQGELSVLDDNQETIQVLVAQTCQILCKRWRLPRLQRKKWLFVVEPYPAIAKIPLTHLATQLGGAIGQQFIQVKLLCRLNPYARTSCANMLNEFIVKAVNVWHEVSSFCG
jgi:hypothetical protein